MCAIWVEQEIAPTIDRSKEVRELEIGLHLEQMAMFVKQLALNGVERATSRTFDAYLIRSRAGTWRPVVKTIVIGGRSSA